MSKTTQTLTIGIPAYNEAKNIVSLLPSLFQQKLGSIRLTEVLISSDGSSDQTVSLAYSLQDPRVRVFANRTRQGIARGLNQIITNTHTDYLVLLDADISLTDPFCLSKLIAPLVAHQAELTSCKIEPIGVNNLIARTLRFSMKIKNHLFETYNNGDNLFTCHGLIRGYSKNLYTNTHFPRNIANDMYSYLDCLNRGFKYQYVAEARVSYLSVSTLPDYLSQSRRFQLGIDNLAPNVSLPFSHYLAQGVYLFKEIMFHPISSLTYLLLLIISHHAAPASVASLNSWDIAESSKG